MKSSTNTINFNEVIFFITRSKDDSEKTKSVLDIEIEKSKIFKQKNINISTEVLPLIKFNPVPIGKTSILKKYDFGVFTSPRSVRFFCESQIFNNQSVPFIDTVLVTGKSTLEEIEKNYQGRFEEIIKIDGGTSEEVINAIRGFKLNRDSSFIYPVGKKRRGLLDEWLHKENVNLDLIEVYDTEYLNVKYNQFDLIRNSIKEGKKIFLIFFSSGTLEHWVSFLKSFSDSKIKELQYISFGETTTSTLRNIGLSEFYSSKAPSMDVFAFQIIEALRKSIS